MEAPESRDTRSVPSKTSPRNAPPNRTRDHSADDLEVDISDPNLDLTFDDEDRLEEDANPGRD